MNPRLMALAGVVVTLFGCSSGGFVPSGPHAIAGTTLSALVNDRARTYAVSPALVSAVVNAESHGDPSAVSRTGAQGLMQLMPGTAREYGVFNAFDPRENVDAGTHYLSDLLRRYRGDVRLAVAAYNAGPGAVDAAHGVPAFGETRAYVARVTAALR